MRSCVLDTELGSTTSTDSEQDAHRYSTVHLRPLVDSDFNKFDEPTAFLRRTVFLMLRPVLSAHSTAGGTGTRTA